MTGKDSACALPSDVIQPGRRDRWLLFLLPAGTVLAAALAHGPFLIDDAYITFRYAENFAAGNGLVFNLGEPVLGTTSPLLAFVLALARCIGIDVPSAARWLGVFAAIGVVVVMQETASRFMKPSAACAMALCLALHPDLAFAANSGMETTASMAAVYGALLLTLDRRFRTAAVVGGIAFLLRPDGALVVLLTVGAAVAHRPRRGWQPLAIAALIILPWMIFATVYYGDWIPHSIPAKQFIHPDTPGHILLSNARRCLLGGPMKFVCGAAGIGLVAAAVRRSKLLIPAAWMVLYFLGLSASRIWPIFPWYVTPLFPGLLLFGACGLGNLVEAGCRRLAGHNLWQSRVARITVAAASLALSVSFVLEAPEWRAGHQMQFGRVDTYLVIGRHLARRCSPGEAVLVGEVGAIAYAMLDQFIIDSSGINSPAALKARRDDRKRLRASGVTRPTPEGSPAWVLDLVERFSPRYIVTYYQWLHAREIAAVPWVNKTYRPIAIDSLASEGYVVVERVRFLPAGR